MAAWHTPKIRMHRFCIRMQIFILKIQRIFEIPIIITEFETQKDISANEQYFTTVSHLLLHWAAILDSKVESCDFSKVSSQNSDLGGHSN